MPLRGPQNYPFVVGEVRKQVSWLDDAVTLGHWRTEGDEEADLVIERDDGRVVAFEVKANARVPGAALKGCDGCGMRSAIGSWRG